MVFCLSIKIKQIIEKPVSYSTTLLLWPLSSPAEAANADDGNAAVAVAVSNTNKKWNGKWSKVKCSKVKQDIQ